MTTTPDRSKPPCCELPRDGSDATTSTAETPCRSARPGGDANRDAWRHRLARVLVAELFLGVGGVYARAGDGPPDTATGGARLVALNQSVSLGASTTEHRSDSAVTTQLAAAAPQRAAAPHESRGADGPRVGPAHAGPTPRTLRRPTHGFDARSTTPWFGTGLGALAIVLVVIGGVAWALRRWVPSARSPDSGLLRVLGRTAVTPRHSVALVHVGRRVVMVGLCGERLNALGEITDADEVALLLSRSTPSPRGRRGVFDELLRGHAAEFHSSSTGEVTEVGEVSEADEAEPGSASPSPRATGRYREPLNDLLRRLRTLQVK